MSPRTTFLISVITLLVSLATLGLVLRMQERLDRIEASAAENTINFGAAAQTCKTDADCPTTEGGVKTQCLEGVCQTKPSWWNIFNDGICLCNDGTTRHKQSKSDSCVDLCAKPPGSGF